MRHTSDIPDLLKARRLLEDMNSAVGRSCKILFSFLSSEAILELPSSLRRSVASFFFCFPGGLLPSWSNVAGVSCRLALITASHDVFLGVLHCIVIQKANV